MLLSQLAVSCVGTRTDVSAEVYNFLFAFPRSMQARGWHRVRSWYRASCVVQQSVKPFTCAGERWPPPVLLGKTWCVKNAKLVVPSVLEETDSWRLTTPASTRSRSCVRHMCTRIILQNIMPCCYAPLKKQNEEPMVPNIFCGYVRKIDRTTRKRLHQPLRGGSCAVIHVPHADSIT